MSSRPDDPRVIGDTPTAPAVITMPTGPKRQDPLWDMRACIPHELLPETCLRLENHGYRVVAVLPAGYGAGGATASVLARKADG